MSAVAAASTAPATAATTTVNQQGLIALYLLGDFGRVSMAGRRPGPDWIKHHGVVGGITSHSRKAALRLARVSTCLRCDEVLSLNTEGDHVIATANGGPAGLENYLPLCGRCNSSKGTRDLLDWWIGHSSRSVRDLPPDVLIVYCRLHFAHYNRIRTLSDPAPDSLVAAVTELLEDLSAEHERMLRTRIAWITGRKW